MDANFFRRLFTVNDLNSDSALPQLTLRRESAYTCDSMIEYTLMQSGDEFSIEISLEENDIVTVERLYSIADCADDALRMFEMIALGSVPPHCAAEVIEDMIECDSFHDTSCKATP